MSICMQKHEQISKASLLSKINQITWKNLHKIQAQAKLNNGDESQNNGYLEITFWVQEKFCILIWEVVT